MAAAQYVSSNRQHQSMGRLPIYVYGLAYVTPVTVTELCLSDLLLFILIKLHLDLNATDPSHYNISTKKVRPRIYK